MLGGWSAERWLVVLFAGIAFGQATIWAVERWRRRWRARRRSRTATQGEKDAERLVERAGFEILERQARTTWHVSLDGEPLEFELRADLLLRRGSKRYVADVKTGSQAPKLTTAATRRQLLEYRCAYDADGVLLVDMTTGSIHAVDFPMPATQARGWDRGWKLLVLVAVASFLLGALIRVG